MKTLNQQIDEILEQEDALWSNSSSEETFEQSDILFKKIYKLENENQTRTHKAKSRQSDYTADQWDSGLVNANDTFANHPRVSKILSDCEFWECVAESAEVIKAG